MTDAEKSAAASRADAIHPAAWHALPTDTAASAASVHLQEVAHTLSPAASTLAPPTALFASVSPPYSAEVHAAGPGEGAPSAPLSAAATAAAAAAPAAAAAAATAATAAAAATADAASARRNFTESATAPTSPSPSASSTNLPPLLMLGAARFAATLTSKQQRCLPFTFDPTHRSALQAAVERRVFLSSDCSSSSDAPVALLPAACSSASSADAVRSVFRLCDADIELLQSCLTMLQRWPCWMQQQ
jgi:hypothetical protein